MTPILPGTLAPMCTVVIRVPEPGRGDIQLLAVRDEDPQRPWRPLGTWWPNQDITGIQDAQAGGAWLAHTDRRLAVLLNRAGGADLPDPTSRGGLVLGSVMGAPLPEPLTTLGFNFVEVWGEGARVTSWEGGAPRVSELEPGTHMIAHDDLNATATPRIAAWRDLFARTPTRGGRWWQAWVEALGETARIVAPTDDRAIIRDNRPHGFPTLSLLVCAASVGPSGVQARMATLKVPGRWNRLTLQ
ncbi:MAG: NRDE family protein [Propionibacteriaceae bacterium]|nr:NRDE family protein [Propionibacteriaceae bacterium]